MKKEVNDFLKGLLRELTLEEFIKLKSKNELVGTVYDGNSNSQEFRSWLLYIEYEDYLEVIELSEDGHSTFP